MLQARENIFWAFRTIAENTSFEMHLPENNNYWSKITNTAHSNMVRWLSGQLTCKDNDWPSEDVSKDEDVDFFQCIIWKPVSSPRCFWGGHFNEVFPLLLPVLRKETSMSNASKTRRSGTNCSTTVLKIIVFSHFLKRKTISALH